MNLTIHPILKAFPMHALLRPLALLRVALLACAIALSLPALAAGQARYPTPQAAVQALTAALTSGDESAILAVLGEEHRNLIVTGNPAEDAASIALIAAELKRVHYLHPLAPDRQLLLIGPQAWPLPIPLVRHAEGWRFATEEGATELMHRRIGANERNAIYVMRAYIEAQLVYASIDRNGDGVREYARRLLSTPGKRDGLYWPADPAIEEPSPFGPLVAASSAGSSAHARGVPYQGYRFKVLTGQGKDAPAGAYSYLINGKMLAGFAMVAWPAVWGETGVMSFIVSRDGKVFEKDLGPNTSAIGAAMRVFNPDAGWREVQP